MNEGGKRGAAAKADRESISRERQLEIIFNASNDSISLISMEPGQAYRFNSVNNPFLLLTGLTKSQFENQLVTDVMPESVQKTFLQYCDQAIEKGTLTRWEDSIEWKTGRKTVLVTLTPIAGEQGQFTLLVCTIQDITERVKKKEEDKHVRHLLGERVKELTTLYRAGNILQNETRPFASVLQELISILPAGWQYPEIAEVRILAMGKQYSTPGFSENLPHQAAIFAIDEINKGRIDLAYRETMPEETEGPFLAEERNLINMIAEMLTAYFARSRVTEQLLKEKELSETIINSLPGIFYLFDENGRYLRWNKNHETIPGYTAEEMRSISPLAFFDEEEGEKIKERIERVFRDGFSEVEAGFKSKDGQKTPYYFNGIRIHYQGRPCLLGVAFDVSERKRSAEQLLKEKELSESIINALPGIFYIVDTSGNHLLWNSNYETITGYDHAAISQMNVGDLLAGESKPGRLQATFEAGYADAELNLRCINGEVLVYYFHSIAINYQDKPCLLAVGIDITGLKYVEQELRDAEIKFRTLVEKSQVGVYIVRKGRFVYVNPRFAGIFGYQPEELLHTDPVQMIISEECRSMVYEKVRLRLSGESETAHYEVTGVRKDGSRNRVEFYGSRALYKGEPTIIGTMVDITERKIAEEALQKSEANLHTIFDTTDTIYTLLDNNFQVMSFNHRAADFVKEEMGKELTLYTNLVSYLPEINRETVRDIFSKVISGEFANYELNHTRHNGQPGWFHVRMFPIGGNEGTIFGMMVAVSDITEKKLLEQEIMNHKVQEQKKMTRAVLQAQESERNKLGQELHDNVNQILVGAKLYLGLISNGKPGTEDLLQQSTNLINNAIDEIRSLTRREVTPPRKIGLHAILQTLVDNTNLHSPVKTRLLYSTDPYVIDNDLKLNIYRIIQEAINNVLKHADARNVTLVVEKRKKELYIMIGDDGKGFDPSKVRSKGVGIANMLNRVESYNGTLTIDGEPGRGSKIEITIPVLMAETGR